MPPFPPDSPAAAAGLFVAANAVPSVPASALLYCQWRSGPREAVAKRPAREHRPRRWLGPAEDQDGHRTAAVAERVPPAQRPQLPQSERTQRRPSCGAAWPHSGWSGPPLGHARPVCLPAQHRGADCLGFRSPDSPPPVRSLCRNGRQTFGNKPIGLLPTCR